jgi:hypothetical protein
MRLSHVVLAPFTGAHDVLHVRYRGRSVEALSEGFPDQQPWHGVVAADASVDLADHLLPLFMRDARDALLQDPRHAPLV